MKMDTFKTFTPTRIIGRIYLLVLFVLALLPGGLESTAHAQPVQWAGNGHWYQVVLAGDPGISWSAASSAATAAGGYLATLTSADENSFVFGLAANPIYWRLDVTANFGLGPWLGGYQSNNTSEPDGNWAWVTGESWSYTRWAPGEPNNSFDAENYLQFFGYGGLMTPQWNDGANEPWVHVPGNTVVSYIIEWTQIPEPSFGALFVIFVASYSAHALKPRREH